MRLAALAAVLAGSLLAAPAFAQSVFDRAEACLKASDRPLCLITAAGDGYPDVVTFDPDLRKRPDLVAAAGIELKPPTAPDGLTRSSQRLEAALVEGARRLAADRPPAEALEPILAAPGPGERDLRLAGLSVVVQPAVEKPLTGSRRAFVAAALQAWEDGLRAGWPSPSLAPPEALAAAYARFGDDAGLDRALRLIPRPDRRVETLLGVGGLDDALIQARQLTPETMLAPLRVEATAQAEMLRRAAASRSLPQLGFFAPPWDQPDALPSSDVQLKAFAAVAVRRARIAVVVAAVKVGRAEMARDLADGVLATPAKTADDALLRNAGPLAAAATPAVAAAWLEQLDKTTGRSARTTEASMALQSRIMAAAAGWAALGRQDRVDALVASLRPLAQREATLRDSRPDEAIQTPASWQLAELLLAADRVDEVRALAIPQNGGRLVENDLKRGRGITRVEDYLSDARTEMDRISVLTACYMGSEQRGAFADALTCHRRRQQILTRPEQQIVQMETAIHTAGLAANADKLDDAQTLLAFALEAGLPAYRANPALRSMVGLSSNGDLVLVAKAELRADGRLPPVAHPTKQ
ncbi:MAG: hypothetical protein KKE02_14520 [Alphaproteobacteria bacterium]|nr:hypothetical protein [Alphaproteobacteria bacterium]MBU1513207.1 hypothetical protein [Alphaproteobacteria bacterium]MBU2095315.1 hypothetical protein [Alphaproteobacteria bacterium]MBU2152230.1 hypothetical protein [Alphaproteobacteria bacterium]MBU2306723.1 hypothetical protein [Alphaproteobacteria bacterium]